MVLGFNSSGQSHVREKIKRDALCTRGDNRLTPYKNRARRWKYPIVLFPGEVAPAEWRRVNIEVVRESEGDKVSFSIGDEGWGKYFLLEEWFRKLKDLPNEAKGAVGCYKIGIPYREAATEENCLIIAKTLAYQAHRIFGEDHEYIAKEYPALAEAVARYRHLQGPECPLCKELMSPDGFIEEQSDSSMPFAKQKESEDQVLQLFHIDPLRSGAFLHRPGNVSWGHRRCNLAVSQHTIDETLDWFEQVLKNHGRI